MKITVLYGDYVIASRTRLVEILNAVKKRGWEIVKYDPRKAISLLDQLSTPSLFGLEKLFVIEGGNIDTGELRGVFKSKLDGNFIFWFDGPIPPTILELLPKPINAEEFRLPHVVFKILDSFYHDNARKVLELIHLVAKKEPIEFIFALLGRHIRDLYWARVSPETIPYPSWRVSKLINQAAKFKEEDLKNLINDFAKADVNSKTSKMDLATSLDLIIAKHLE